MSSESFYRRTALSFTGSINAGMLPPHFKPWQRMDWSSCTQARIFKDWAQYYSRRERYRKALQYFDYSLDVCNAENLCANSRKTVQPFCSCNMNSVESCPPYYITLDERSRCKQDMARTEEAVLDSEEAERLMRKRGIANLKVTLGKSNALFKSNLFEENLIVLHTVEHEFPGQTMKKCIDTHKQRVREGGS